MKIKLNYRHASLFILFWISAWTSVAQGVELDYQSYYTVEQRAEGEKDNFVWENSGDKLIMNRYGYRADDANTKMQVLFKPQTSGYVKIGASNSANVLDANGGGVGALITYKAADNSDDQLWRLEDLGTGYYRVTSKSTGLSVSYSDDTNPSGDYTDSVAILANPGSGTRTEWVLRQSWITPKNCITVNQNGWGPAQTKISVLSRDLPITPPSFNVTGPQTLSGTMTSWGEKFSRNFYQADLTSLTAIGHYTIEADGLSQEFSIVSDPFENIRADRGGVVEWGDVVDGYLAAQAVKYPGDYLQEGIGHQPPPEYIADSYTTLTGGYYDASSLDNKIYRTTQIYRSLAIAYMETPDLAKRAQITQPMLDGIDWLERRKQVDGSWQLGKVRDGGDNYYWCVNTDPGGVSQVVIALALMAQALDADNHTVATNALAMAESGWDWVMANSSTDSDFTGPSDGYFGSQSDLIGAAIELYHATGLAEYKTYADTRVLEAEYSAQGKYQSTGTPWPGSTTSREYRIGIYLSRYHPVADANVKTAIETQLSDLNYYYKEHLTGSQTPWNNVGKQGAIRVRQGWFRESGAFAHALIEVARVLGTSDALDAALAEWDAVAGNNAWGSNCFVGGRGEGKIPLWHQPWQHMVGAVVPGPILVTSTDTNTAITSQEFTFVNAGYPQSEQVVMSTIPMIPFWAIANQLLPPLTGNQAPEFYAATIQGKDADVGVAYAGSLADSAFDSDGDALTYALVSAPSWLNVATNGTLFGTPTFAAEDEFTVSVTDGQNAPVTALLNVKVGIAPLNHAPTWRQNPVVKTGYDVNVYKDTWLNGNVEDLDTDALTFAIISGPPWVSLTNPSNGKLSGTPTSADEGINVVSMTVTDGVSAPVAGTVHLVVNPAPLTTVLPNDAAIRYVGRFTDNYQFGWSGTTVETEFTGSKIQANLDLVQDAEAGLNIVIDGVPHYLHVTQTSGTYTLAEDLEVGVPHKIQIFKRSEGAQGTLQFNGFRISNDGALSLPDAPARKMLVIGDSITCGAGNEALTVDEVVRPLSLGNGYMSYAPIAARTLGADVMMFSWSGRGMYRNGSGPALVGTIPLMFNQTLPDDATPQWDHLDYVPDVIVINLGTNDRKDTDRPPLEDLETEFKDTYTNFIGRLRGYYPDSEIVLCIGPMQKAPVDGWLPEIAAQFTNTSAHIFADYIGNEEKGLGYHPNVAKDISMGAELVSWIQAGTGWDSETEALVSYQFNEAVGTDWTAALNRGSDAGAWNSANADALIDGAWHLDIQANADAYRTYILDNPVTTGVLNLEFRVNNWNLANSVSGSGITFALNNWTAKMLFNNSDATRMAIKSVVQGGATEAGYLDGHTHTNGYLDLHQSTNGVTVRMEVDLDAAGGPVMSSSFKPDGTHGFVTLASEQAYPDATNGISSVRFFTEGTTPWAVGDYIELDTFALSVTDATPPTSVALSYIAGSGGTLSGAVSQTIDYNSSGTAVTALPDNGYSFVNWSDARTDNPRTDTSVTADVTVTANFALVPPDNPTWNGAAADGDWNNPANWEAGFIPADQMLDKDGISGDMTIIFNGDSVPTNCPGIGGEYNPGKTIGDTPVIKVLKGVLTLPITARDLGFWHETRNETHTAVDVGNGIDPVKLTLDADGTINLARHNVGVVNQFFVNENAELTFTKQVKMGLNAGRWGEIFVATNGMLTLDETINLNGITNAALVTLELGAVMTGKYGVSFADQAAVEAAVGSYFVAADTHTTFLTVEDVGGTHFKIGTTNAVTPESLYEAWLDGKYPEGTPVEDVLAEYAGDGTMPASFTDADALYLEHVEWMDATARGLTYVIEATDDLTSPVWPLMVIEHSSTENAPEAGRKTVVSKVWFEEGEKQFIRVKVDYAP